MKVYVRIFCLFLATGFAHAAQIPEKLNEAIKVQVLLDRADFSSGEIDGSIGSRTQKTLSAYQKAYGLNVTGKPDEATVAALEEANPGEPLIAYVITAEDVKGPFVEKIPEDMLEQSKLEHLSYASPLEAIGEKFHSNPQLLKRLNPNAQFLEGEEILVPNVLFETIGSANELQTQATQEQSEAQSQNVEPQSATTSITQNVLRKAQANSKKGNKDVQIIVDAENSALTVENGSGDILFYAPVTSGSEHDPLPMGQWQVTSVATNPSFHYNPELFWDAEASDSKAKIAAGPNNPVGVAWIDINKEHYGIHGSPEPSKIGKTESYGCVRLTNWDIKKLLEYAKPGTKVVFQ